MAPGDDRTNDGDGSTWMVPPPYIASAGPNPAAETVAEAPSVVEQAPTPAPAPVARPPVNYRPADAGWWLATDNLWYPPESMPAQVAPVPAAPMPAPQPAMGLPVQQMYAPAPIVHVLASPPKSKVAAGLLALFLGTLGIHRFYLGYTGLGITMLLLTLLSFGFLLPITAIWALIDAILIFTGSITDSKNQPLT